MRDCQLCACVFILFHIHLNKSWVFPVDDFVKLIAVYFYM